MRNLCRFRSNFLGWGSGSGYPEPDLFTIPMSVHDCSFVGGQRHLPSLWSFTDSFDIMFFNAVFPFSLVTFSYFDVFLIRDMCGTIL